MRPELQKLLGRSRVQLGGRAGTGWRPASEREAVCAAMIDLARCRNRSSGLRVRVLATGLTAYPDVSVICGPLERDPESDSTVTNPKVLVEVLSEGTAAYDRGEKLEQYKLIDSLQAVLRFSQSSRRVEVNERFLQGWRTEVFAGDQLVKLPGIGAELSLARVYDDAGL